MRIVSKMSFICPPDRHEALRFRAHLPKLRRAPFANETVASSGPSSGPIVAPLPASSVAMRAVNLMFRFIFAELPKDVALRGGEEVRPIPVEALAHLDDRDDGHTRGRGNIRLSGFGRSLGGEEELED